MQAPGREKYEPLGVKTTSDSGEGTILRRGGRERVVVAGIGGELHTRGIHAVIIAFYPGSHVQLNVESTANSR